MAIKKFLNNFLAASIFFLVFSCGKKTATQEGSTQVEAPSKIEWTEPLSEAEIKNEETKELSIDEMEANALYVWVNEINPKLEPFKYDYIKHSQIDEYHLEIKPWTIDGKSYLIGYYETVLIDIRTTPATNISENHAYVMGLEDSIENDNEKTYKFVSINRVSVDKKNGQLYVASYIDASKSEFQFTLKRSLNNSNIDVVVEKGYYGEDINFTKNIVSPNDNGSDSITPSYSGGSGTKESPYLISSDSDWKALAKAVALGNDYVDEYFLLTKDISGISNVVGVSILDSQSKHFKGTFDGQGHTINVTITENNVRGNQWGLFGFLEKATVKNINVSGDISIYMGNVGVICLKAENSIISNCHNFANITIGKLYYSTGGICAFARQGVKIQKCSNEGNISASFDDSNPQCIIGGICGLMDWYDGHEPISVIDGCYTKGNINVNLKYLGDRDICEVGGIVGQVHNYRIIVKNCFAGNERIKISVPNSVGKPSVYRVAGNAYDQSMINCYASSSMLINGSPRKNDNSSSKDGKDSSFEDFKNNLK